MRLVNCTNLSRYSDLSERTYRRHFERGIGFEGFNQVLIEPLRRDETVQIGVVDCTFLEYKLRGVLFWLDEEPGF